MLNALESPSLRPYLLRAIYEWCGDNGFTPYVAVQVDETVQVPREYVKNGEIVLNISYDATSSLKLGNDFIEFKARFGGSAREILVPVQRVRAIYARENGEGMAFPAGTDAPGAAPTKLTPPALVPGAPAFGATRLALRDASKSAGADAASPASTASSASPASLLRNVVQLLPAEDVPGIKIEGADLSEDTPAPAPTANDGSADGAPSATDDTGADETASPNPDDSTPRPPAGGTGRPSLKRIK